MAVSARPRMLLFYRHFIKRAALAGLVAGCLAAPAFGQADGMDLDMASDMATRYVTQVDRRLNVPGDDARRYAQLAEEALAAAGITLAQPGYVVVVDRAPLVQALMLFFRQDDGAWQLVGASPVSTGRPGSFEHFKTPLGVFAHSLDNPDYRAEGTRNSLGIMGYGIKGMRVYDFGWQAAPKGWGNGAVSEMRLQMHATDPGLLENRLGSVQSKGCIRIPASLNRLLDQYGVLDADYEQAQREGANLWVLQPGREPVLFPGRYVIVVDSGRAQRPPWSPAPRLPRGKTLAPAAR